MWDFSKSPAETDGEAANPGPRLRRRGPRSAEAQQRRAFRQTLFLQQAEISETCEQDSNPTDLKSLFDCPEFTILQINIRGLVRNSAELSARLALLPAYPDVLCLNETFLDRSVPSFSIPWYECISRRDRDTGQKGGGIATFVRTRLSQQVTLLEKSECAEREWMLIHGQYGPVLLCNWYRPPSDPRDSIGTLKAEWSRLQQSALGTIIVGDVNVHHKSWLRFSSSDTPEGRELYHVSHDCNWMQYVREPTREGNLLDLVLSDMDVSCSVLPRLADHCLVLTSLKYAVPEVSSRTRTVWNFRDADWQSCHDALARKDWTSLEAIGVSDGAQQLTEIILCEARSCIPQRLLEESKCSHPWLTPHILSLVDQKRRAVGTPQEAEAAANCSSEILMEFGRYTERTKAKLSSMQRGSKQWWRLSRQLSGQSTTVSSIPALKGPDDSWTRDPGAKATLLANTFSAKCVVPELEVNFFSSVAENEIPEIDGGKISSKLAYEKMMALKPESATGPDLLPTRVLIEMASSLAEPVAILAQRILDTGEWPDSWRIHWIVAIYKKLSVFNPKNYRGVHLTSQLSKVVERMIHDVTMPYVKALEGFGPNQFAYSEEKGSRDALALLSLSWILAFENRQKVGVFCSDVQGAFDRVRASRLAAKLESIGIPSKIVRVLCAWLEDRRAVVVVEGSSSTEQNLRNMVFQGTVLGPLLWNLFFADAGCAIRLMSFMEVVFADDLNAWRSFPMSCSNPEILDKCSECQDSLHSWGRANAVTFDPAKESKHVLSRHDPAGGNFRILGVTFDPKLLMSDCVGEITCSASWRLHTLLRSRRFHTVAELVHLYKSQILSYIEYRTAAIYHSADTHLNRIDAIQRRFLREVGLTEAAALTEYHLAPLPARRDMAMLGLLHRAVLGRGPPQLSAFFQLDRKEGREYTRADHRRHDRQICEYRTGHFSELMRRSAFGLVAVYNSLPKKIVSCNSVGDFQRQLQSLMAKQAGSAADGWELLFSPRVPMYRHPLRTQLSSYC